MFFQRKKNPKPFVSFRKSTTFASQFERGALFPTLLKEKLGYGVIGNTTDSGPVIPGSSPGIPTTTEASDIHLKPLLSDNDTSFH